MNTYIIHNESLLEIHVDETVTQVSCADSMSELDVKRYAFCVSTMWK